MYNFFKRLLDIAVSFLTLIILLPVFIPIIIILRLSAEGEVFYFQERYGIHNSRFQIWKFATMLKNSMNIGTGSITLQNDPRVTKIGSFLRKTKINELPQIINILKGDISLVGPRPLVKKTFSAYNKEIQSKIYDVKPGLTGIGSIIFRDEESIISAVKDEDPHDFYKRVIAPYKGELEMWYQAKRSLIRIEADELTYSLHVMVRYELEKALINGKLKVKDLPKRWNKLMSQYVGKRPTTDKDGVLQDIHWSGGAFGYFPTYALGSAYAAQIYESMNKDLNVNQAIENNDIASINEWCKEHIHKFAQTKTPDEIMHIATKQEFSPHYYVDYLKEKFSM